MTRTTTPDAVAPALHDAKGPALHDEIYALARRLFPIHRSITGEGVRQTLRELQAILPELTLHEVPSGTEVFDWTVPDEWNVREAYVMDEAGRKVIDFRQNNLHVVAYSVPVDRVVELSELEAHLHSLPDQPEAIPYVTSYYERRWGFCMAHAERETLTPGRYRVVIDSTLAPGSLTYGELLLPGREEKEILLSTYLCHPALANDNLSGVVVTAFLARWLREQVDRRYTYRILFIPETIGAVTYLSRHLAHLKAHTVAGFVLTCVGDDRAYSFVPSRLGGTLADKVALHVLAHYAPDFVRYSFLQRGSDERQYCSPGVDLPVVSMPRSKYGAFPEYHTSLDDLSLVSARGLGGSYELHRRCLEALEHNYRYRTTTLGEPQLGRHGLFPTLSIKGSTHRVVDLLNVLVYCDGRHDLLDVATITALPVDRCRAIVDVLHAHGLVERMEE